MPAQRRQESRPDRRRRRSASAVRVARGGIALTGCSGIAGMEGQHLEAVPAEHASRPASAPARPNPDRSPGRPRPARSQSASARADRVGERPGPPFRHQDPAAPVDDRRDRVGEDDAGIGEEPPQLPEWWAPSRSSTSESKLNAPRVPRKIVGRSGAAAARPRRSARRRRARLVASQNSAQAGRADLLAHLDQELGVEAEPAARLRARSASAAILIVCWPLLSAVPRPYIAVAARSAPRRRPSSPLLLEAADHVAVAVAEHRRQAPVLAALGEQQRAARTGFGTISLSKPSRANDGAISSPR